MIRHVKIEYDSDKFGGDIIIAVLPNGDRVYLKEVDADEPDEIAEHPEGGWHAYKDYNSRTGHSGYIGPAEAPPPRPRCYGGV